MAEGEQITVYDAETHQPLTVTVNAAGTDDGTGVQNIQYITPDGQVAQLQSDLVQVEIQCVIVFLEYQSQVHSESQGSGCCHTGTSSLHCCN